MFADLENRLDLICGVQTLRNLFCRQRFDLGSAKKLNRLGLDRDRRSSDLPPSCLPQLPADDKH